MRQLHGQSPVELGRELAHTEPRGALELQEGREWQNSPGLKLDSGVIRVCFIIILCYLHTEPIKLRKKKESYGNRGVMLAAES